MSRLFVLLAITGVAVIACAESAPLPPVTPDLIQRTATTISAGSYHTCALLPDGSPVCWGANDHGQAPKEFTHSVKLTAVTSGGAHSCGLGSDGSWACWGDYFHRPQVLRPREMIEAFGILFPPEIELPPPHPSERFIAISSGLGHACALRPDGEAVCWGANTTGQASPFEGELLRAISSGDRHTCGLRFDDSRVCWSMGDWKTYLLTDEDIEEMAIPIECPPGRGYQSSGRVYWRGPEPPPESLYAGLDLICDGRWYACGVNSANPDGYTCWTGKRWMDEEADRFLVIQCPPIDRAQGPRCAERNAKEIHSEGSRLAAISSGGGHTCALRPDGSPVCWGDVQLAEARGNEYYEVVSKGDSHVCKSVEGRSYTKGDVAVCRGFEALADERFAAISSGSEHTCALRMDGSPVCWGHNEGWAYGLNGALTKMGGQASAPEGERFVAISSGRFHTCGLRVDGSAVCWGSNSHGQASPPDMRFATSLGGSP